MVLLLFYLLDVWDVRWCVTGSRRSHNADNRQIFLTRILKYVTSRFHIPAIFFMICEWLPSWTTFFLTHQQLVINYSLFFLSILIAHRSLSMKRSSSYCSVLSRYIDRSSLSDLHKTFRKAEPKASEIWSEIFRNLRSSRDGGDDPLTTAVIVSNRQEDCTNKSGATDNSQFVCGLVSQIARTRIYRNTRTLTVMVVNDRQIGRPS